MEELENLKLTVYVPSLFIHPSKRAKYEIDDSGSGGFDQMGRELGIRRLMAINLLKRLESSVYSFRLTIQRVKAYVKQTIKIVEEFQNHKNNSQINIKDLSFDADYDFDDQHHRDSIDRTHKKLKKIIALCPEKT